MSRRRWIADAAHGDTAELRGDHAAHLSRVLRAKVGQEFEIAADGRVRLGRIRQISEDVVSFDLGEEVAEAQSLELTFILAIYKYDRLEWAIEKLTEIGVSRIIPAISRRTDAHLAASAAKRAERWRRIAREAAQQSRRQAPPEITDPVKLKEVIASAVGFRILLAESEDDTTLKQALATSAFGPITLAIGPEGGWTEDELQLFAASGWQSASLSSTILRAETAAIAAAAVVASELAASR
jgi:16S rRNA (uracil1498-N3)-methyltransferase